MCPIYRFFMNNKNKELVEIQSYKSTSKFNFSSLSLSFDINQDNYKDIVFIHQSSIKKDTEPQITVFLNSDILNNNNVDFKISTNKYSTKKI